MQLQSPETLKLIADEAYNRTVDKFNRYEKIARLTPTLMASAAVTGLALGWVAKRWWDNNSPYWR